MKKLLVGALALLALTACNQDNKSEALQQEAMQFGSNIPALNLRMANNAFEANDAIGISMTGDATATNVEYKTTAGGATATFAPATTGLTFAEGQTVNFVSYYPYSASATTDLAIDLSNAQTDVLYSNNLTGIKTPKDATGANHVLRFTHKLALVSFTMTGLPAGTTITSAQLEGIVTTSTMKIADGTLTNGTKTATQQLQLAAGTFAPTIVIPATNSNAKLVITLSDGKSYSYTFANLALQSGKNHKFNVSLASNALTVDEINGQISDWDVVDGDDIIVNPDDNGGTEPEPNPNPEPAGENVYNVDLTQTARTLPLSDDFAKGGKDYDPFALPGWLNKALVGTRDFQKRSYGGVHYAQASAYKSTDPVNKCVLITPRLQMTAGSSYTVELTYSSGHTNGATLTVQQLDKDGALVKTLEVINDSTSPSGYGNQHYKKSYAIAGSAEAGYIALLYEASQEPLHTTTYQVEALTVK